MVGNVGLFPFVEDDVTAAVLPEEGSKAAYDVTVGLVVSRVDEQDGRRASDWGRFATPQCWNDCNRTILRITEIVVFKFADY